MFGPFQVELTADAGALLESIGIRGGSGNSGHGSNDNGDELHFAGEVFDRQIG